MAPTFSRKPSVDAERLRTEPFKETQKVKGFTCGSKPLDDFLTTTEVERFGREGLGRTFLVFNDGALIAYYTLSHDSLRIEYVTHVKSMSKVQELHVDALPALKVGRLAVATEYQGRGVGRTIIAMIVAEALMQGQRSGVRLVILEAKPASIPFYEKCGFVLTKETRRERNKKNRTMFLDLQALDGMRL